MRILKHLNKLNGIPRFILSVSLILADLVIIYSIYCFLQGGLRMIMLSQNVFALGTGICAEGVALGLFGDILLKRISSD